MSNVFSTVAETTEIPEGQGKCVEIFGKRIAVFHLEGKYYAIDDTCTHAGGPLSEGDVVGTEVTCPWHGATFDVTTGQVLSGPAARSVGSYPVKVEGNEIKIEVPGVPN